MKLEPCPFCGGEAVITRRGNDLTRTRAVEIKCPLCGVKRVTGAIRQPLAWCETTATKLWNARPASGGLEGAAVERVFATILDGTLDNVARASLGEALKALRALPDSGEVERIAEAGNVIEGLLSEWDKLTRYGSPMAKAANEQVARARAFIATTTPEEKP